MKPPVNRILGKPFSSIYKTKIFECFVFTFNTSYFQCYYHFHHHILGKIDLSNDIVLKFSSKMNTRKQKQMTSSAMETNKSLYI